MTRWLIALLLIASPASADALFDLYAAGKYDEAMREGPAANTANGFAIAARAALADAALRPTPCLECLQRAEGFARKAVAADPSQADGHVWLAASIGLEGRITGLLHETRAAGEAKDQLDMALKDDPRHAYAMAAMGGWNIEVVKGGGVIGAALFGAGEKTALSWFDRSAAASPGNVAVRYQIGLSLSGFKPDRYRDRIIQEFDATIHGTPQTTYEKAMQARAAELEALLQKNDTKTFAARVRQFQGIPD
jgi:hypothetical protein